MAVDLREDDEMGRCGAGLLFANISDWGFPLHNPMFHGDFLGSPRYRAARFRLPCGAILDREARACGANIAAIVSRKAAPLFTAEWVPTSAFHATLGGHGFTLRGWLVGEWVPRLNFFPDLVRVSLHEPLFAGDRAAFRRLSALHRLIGGPVLAADLA